MDIKDKKKITKRVQDLHRSTEKSTMFIQDTVIMTTLHDLAYTRAYGMQGQDLLERSFEEALARYFKAIVDIKVATEELDLIKELYQQDLK